MRRTDLLSQELDGELVLLDRVTGYVHQLNATARSIWEMFDGSRSAEDIARHLATAFEDPPPLEHLLQDVATTLAEFHRLGLLTTALEGSRQPSD